MNKTSLEIVTLVLNSELPIGTKNAVATHYLLPRPGQSLAPIEIEDDNEVGAVDRPTAEEIDLENNPTRKAGDLATEKLMRRK